MARLQNNPGYVPYDQTITEALELFCNVPEQSYEQFMSTFTHLTPDNVMGACLNVLREHHTTSHGEMGRPNRNIMDSGVDAVYKRGSSPRGQGNTLSTDLEELEQDGRVPAGRLSHRATFPSHPPGKIPDNCVDDTQDKEEPLHSTEAVCVFPGEVEEDLSACTPSFCHYTLLDLSSAGLDHRTHTPLTECQSESDEVVPFSLDDNFDYDNVALHQKQPIQRCTSSSS
ncbi:intraflagellar transport-associated protein isoform X2 [Brachyhypopomus gauderio]